MNEKEFIEEFCENCDEKSRCSDAEGDLIIEQVKICMEAYKCPKKN